MWNLIRPLLFRMDEQAHRWSLETPEEYPSLCKAHEDYQSSPNTKSSVRVAGLQFASPIGLAAGLDKGGEAFHRNRGFGFIEVGTTARQTEILIETLSLD